MYTMYTSGGEHELSRRASQRRKEKDMLIERVRDFLAKRDGRMELGELICQFSDGGKNLSKVSMVREFVSQCCFTKYQEGEQIVVIKGSNKTSGTPAARQRDPDNQSTNVKLDADGFQRPDIPPNLVRGINRPRSATMTAPRAIRIGCPSQSGRTTPVERPAGDRQAGGRQRTWSVSRGLQRSLNHDTKSLDGDLLARSPSFCRTRPTSLYEWRRSRTSDGSLDTPSDGEGEFQRSTYRMMSLRGPSRFMDRTLGVEPSLSTHSLLGKEKLASLDRKWSALAVAQNLDGMQSMIKEEPAIVNRRDFIFGYTALHWAAKLNNIPMAELLLNSQAYVNFPSLSGLTPLHLAARHGGNEIVRLLLNANASCDLRDCSGKQAKDMASPHLEPEIRLMLFSNLKRTVTLHYGRTRSADELAAARLVSPGQTPTADTPDNVGIGQRIRLMARNFRSSSRDGPRRGASDLLRASQSNGNIASLLAASTVYQRGLTPRSSSHRVHQLYDPARENIPRTAAFLSPCSSLSPPVGRKEKAQTLV